MAQKKKLSEKVDKRRRAKVVVGHDADGRQIVKYVSGRNRRELNDAKAELRRKYIAGVYTPKNRLFCEFVENWLEGTKKSTVKYETYLDYRSHLDKHLLPAFGDRQIGAISSGDLQMQLNRLAQTGYSASLVRKIYQTIRQIFASAYAQRCIDYDPTIAVKCPNASEGSRRELTNAETAAALAIGFSHPRGIIILILYYTGMRIGEVLGLQWKDIDFGTRSIHVQRDISLKTGQVDTLKSTASDRHIPIPSELYTVLDRVRSIGDGYVICANRRKSHLTKSSYVDIWDDLAKAMYDFDPSIEHQTSHMRHSKQAFKRSVLTAHYFRHNYASILYNSGVDVLTAKELLGHEKVETTLKIYSHLSAQKKRTEVEKIQPAFAALKAAAKDIRTTE